MSLILLGLNHQTAPLAVREQVVFSRDEAQATLRRIREEHNVPQALLLSTCNRTELYALVPDPEATEDRLRQTLFLDRIGEQNGDRGRYLYRREGDEAVQHLFRVACGLDSLVLGEQEILGQVKTAYEISRSVEAAGSVFHRLATRAFHVGKRARTDTQIGLGAVSVAFAAVELAEKVFQSLEGRGALLVGAGENGALCAQHLLSRRVKPLFIANRTLAKAEALAGQLGGETVSFERLREAMTRVDIVVSTTGAPDPVIGRELVKEAMKDRDHRALVLIDIAVPRDVDPAVDDIQSVFRFDMDALSSIVDRNMERRRKEVPVVEGLIRTEVENFMRWWKSLAAGPVIRDLNRAFEEVREVEVERNAKRFVDKDREQLDIFSRNLVRKLLMGLTTEIKQYRAEDSVEMERLAALRKVFRLDEAYEERKGTDREE
jgi:glutamyl-tRNA reductase